MLHMLLHMLATAYATSSNINMGIRAVLFFKRKDFTRTKSTKTHISEQKQKRQRFYAVKNI